MANGVAQDQKEQSDLGLHCLNMPFYHVFKGVFNAYSVTQRPIQTKAKISLKLELLYESILHPLSESLDTKRPGGRVVSAPDKG